MYYNKPIEEKNDKGIHQLTERDAKTLKNRYNMSNIQPLTPTQLINQKSKILDKWYSSTGHKKMTRDQFKIWKDKKLKELLNQS